jgi:hypothetical protein
LPKIFTSLIQSDFGGDHGNFEAVILEGNALNHWWRDNTGPSFPWKRGQTIAQGAAGAGCIIQSDFKGGAHGNFEVVVPLSVPGGTMDLWHYWHDNSDVNLPWRSGQRIATSVAGPACIIQSDFKGGAHGNFEVVVPLFGPGRTMELWHYWHNNSDVNLPWRSGQRIATNVAGPGCIIQSDFKGGAHGNFEVVVPLFAADGSMELWHYWHDNSDVNLPWRSGQRIATNVAGPACIIQSDFKGGAHGNFEVVAPQRWSLTHFWHDNSDVNLPWSRGQIITDSAGGWGCLIQNNFGDGPHGNFEVLAEECTQSVVAYWHPNQNVNWRWLRDDVILGEPYPQLHVDTKKVVQLTGEYDREGWNGQGSPGFAFNRTESRFRIRGTDLGVSFEHKNRVYFLFGDTWRVNQTPAEQDLDSIAFCTDTDPTKGLSLTFYKQPPLLPAIKQNGFNVPVDGVSWNGAMYVYFTTDSYEIAKYRVKASDPVEKYDLMGRSVLGRSDNDGYDFIYILEFSHQKFVNVSVEPGKLDQRTASMLHLDAGAQVLWIWGTGRYRASDIYLAVTPLKSIETMQQVQFFSGSAATPAWSTNEDDAVPLFCAGDVGELSVRWNPFLARYLAMFNSGNPRGILLHSSPTPWGPWSAAPVMVFDPGVLADPANPCSGAGYGRFMHIPWNVRVCDHVQDDMFGSPRNDDWGGEYGPYQITRYATGDRDKWTRIYFTMSTWNPYQSMLMTALIPHGVV